MKKLKLSVLTAFMMGGMLFTQQSQAQPGPCGWDITSQVSQPTCYKVCNGSISVAPTVNWPDFEYLWSNGNTTSNIIDLCEDEYIVTITDDKKCSQTYTFSIIEPLEVVASCVTLNDESYCGAGDGSLEASAVGGDGNFTFEWQTNPIQVNPVATGLAAGTYTVIVYDGNDCTATTTCDITCEKKEDCDGFRTQTQGGWGQCQLSGNNPGTYLAANFDAAFPNDLTIGCTRTLTLTSASAVCDFLPSTTSPKVLPVGAAFVDPGQTYKNVFAGQLVAATLNVGFDLYDDDFGDATTNLGDLEIESGPFAGWTVNELIAEANEKIGGCGSPYSASLLSAALDSVNNNYTDGTVDNGYLVCPEKKEDRLEANNAAQLINIFPNPVSGNANIAITSVRDENIQVDVYNVSGQKVAALFKGEVKTGESLNLNLDGASMNAGIYFVKVINSVNVYTQKFVVKN